MCGRSKLGQLFFVFFFLASNFLWGNISDEKPLFVSLGSMCYSAQLIKDAGYRVASYPFDWSLTIDSEGMIEALESRLADFLTDEYLVMHPGGLLSNTHYRIIFAHEGGWQGELYGSKIQEFKERFTRRIARFLSLNNYKGKVCFLRNSWSASDEDGGHFRDRENIIISDAFSIRMEAALRRCFPDLDFVLVIFNPEQDREPITQLNDNIFIVNMGLPFEQIIETVQRP
jgi:hypothetical protein